MRLLYVILLCLILMVVIAEAKKGGKKKKPAKEGKKPAGKGKKPAGKKPSKPEKKPSKKPNRPPKPGTPQMAAFLEKLFKPFTKKNTGCPCWFDLTRDDCACCKNGGKQCGAPQNEWCYSYKGNGGCPGVKNDKYTLSQEGHPCYWDPEGKSVECAWCAPGGFQCGDSCVRKEDALKCKEGRTGVQGDCYHIPVCDINAECVETKEADGLKWSRCVCNKGTTKNDTFTGNGIQCFNGNGVGGDPSKQVDVQMTLTTDFYVFPHDSSDFPLGPAADNLFSLIDDMFQSGKPCVGCNATVIKLNGSP